VDQGRKARKARKARKRNKEETKGFIISKGVRALNYRHREGEVSESELCQSINQYLPSSLLVLADPFAFLDHSSLFISLKRGAKSSLEVKKMVVVEETTFLFTSESINEGK